MFTRFQEVALCLCAIKSTLQPGLRTVKRHIGDDDLKFELLNYLMIQVQSFMDEWSKLGALLQEVRGLRDTLEIASPAVRRIKRWRGLYDVRSKLLAHAPRNREGRLTEVEELFANGTFPTNYAEQLLIAECAVYAISTVICRHEDEVSDAQRRYYGRELPVVGNHGIRTLDEFRTDLAEVRREIVLRDPDLDRQFGPFNPI